MNTRPVVQSFKMSLQVIAAMPSHGGVTARLRRICNYNQMRKASLKLLNYSATVSVLLTLKVTSYFNYLYFTARHNKWEKLNPLFISQSHQKHNYDAHLLHAEILN
jgi:hypothetical protein